jgi:hypothetical protein
VVKDGGRKAQEVGGHLCELFSVGDVAARAERGYDETDDSQPESNESKECGSFGCLKRHNHDKSCSFFG